MSNLEARVGAIAYCQHGHLGVILDRKTIKKDKVWTGVHLNRRRGEPIKCWQSKTPEVIGYIEDMPTFVRHFNNTHE